MNAIINPAWRYTYVGPVAALHGRICYGCRNSRTGRRIWGSGPGPRNALVWFEHSRRFVVVPTFERGRVNLRKVKE